MSTDTDNPRNESLVDGSISIDEETFTADYLTYLHDSPSPYHAASKAAHHLQESGFVALSRGEEWPTEPGAYLLKNEGSLIAWIIPTQTPIGFSIVGTHTDSPALKIKPTPQRTTADGWGQILTEIYGGPLMNSWLDRELLVAGLIVDKTGAEHLARTGPIARVSQLAIHLHRELRTEGLKLDPQQHMQPVWTVDDPDVKVLDLVAQSAGLNSADDIGGSDLFLYPSQPPGLFGSHNQFVAAGRQDNLSSTFAALWAMMRVGRAVSAGEPFEAKHVPVFAVFDNEEVGSNTALGAHGPMLPSTLQRISAGMGMGVAGYERLLARTSLLSADASHSVHPSYADMHDPDTRPVMGRGPILKLDADQHYATSARGQALWAQVCTAADVPWQSFVSQSSIRSGSTIGPGLSTSLGVTTIDVGIGLLSMHSAREMSHVDDTRWLAQALYAYWAKDYPTWRQDG